MEITYPCKGDCLYPNLFLPEVNPVAPGKYGSLRKSHLRNSKPYLYHGLLLDEKLNEHMEEIDETTYATLNRLVDWMARAENVAERL